MNQTMRPGILFNDKGTMMVTVRPFDCENWWCENEDGAGGLWLYSVSYVVAHTAGARPEPEVALLGCPRCGSTNLYRYTKRSACVRCEHCGYYNTEANWNNGDDSQAWDHLWIMRMRSFEAETAQALEVVLLLKSALNSTPAYWGDSMDDEDYQKVVEYLRKKKEWED